jgi:4-hydroxy-tetrahydrodipicolinate reductase
MGLTLLELIREMPGIETAAAVDRSAQGTEGFPAFERIGDCDIPSDVVIDFSSPGAVPEVASYCISRRLPLVLATTGLGPDERALVQAAAAEIPVFLSPNFSLGIGWLSLVLEAYGGMLAGLFQVDVLEKHHTMKKDLPGGTALMLAERAGCPADRIHAVRTGTIPGEHTVLFAGADETLELVHRAYDRSIFARGALEAARFLVGQAPGLYSMKELLTSMGLVPGTHQA